MGVDAVAVATERLSKVHATVGQRCHAREFAMLLVLPLISSRAIRHYSRNAKIGYEKFFHHAFSSYRILLDPSIHQYPFARQRACQKARILNYLKSYKKLNKSNIFILQKCRKINNKKQKCSIQQLCQLSGLSQFFQSNTHGPGSGRYGA